MKKIKIFIQNLRFLFNINLADEELQVRGLIKDDRYDLQRLEHKMRREIGRLRDDMERRQSNMRTYRKIKNKD